MKTIKELESMTKDAIVEYAETFGYEADGTMLKALLVEDVFNAQPITEEAEEAVEEVIEEVEEPVEIEEVEEVEEPVEIEVVETVEEVAPVAPVVPATDPAVVARRRRYYACN